MALSSAPAANPDYPAADVVASAPGQRQYRGRGGCNGCGGGCGGGYGGCSGGYGGAGWGAGCHGGGGWGGGCHGGGGWGGGCSGGGWGCNGGRTMMYGPEPARAMPEPVPAPMTRQDAPAPATLVVNLPADGVLTIDDAPTAAVAARRTFVSPPLAPGVEYHYNLKMELQRNGQTVAVTRRVAVRAGQQTEVTLDPPAAGVAQR